MARKSPSHAPTPDFEPIPGSPPKRFPNAPEPKSTKIPGPSPDGDPDSPARSGAGEDPTVESGVPDHDPEQPRKTEDEEPMR